MCGSDRFSRACTEIDQRDPRDRPKVDLSGTWTGVESSFFGDRTAVLSLAAKGSSYEGSYAELITGDSPVYKLSSLAISGQNVTIVFKASLHPDVSLRATLSADGRTLTGVFGTAPVTLTRWWSCPEVLRVM